MQLDSIDRKCKIPRVPYNVHAIIAWTSTQTKERQQKVNDCSTQLLLY